jgi:hypothetical protein
VGWGEEFLADCAGEGKGVTQIAADKGADERRFLIRLVVECGVPVGVEGFDPADLGEAFLLE